MSNNKFKENPILTRNIVLIVIMLVILLIFSLTGLSLITRHGKYVVVPDFTNLNQSESASLARNKNVRVQVVDTTYVKSVRRGSVYMQEPAAGSKVKPGRVIRLVINSQTPRMVPMPNVVDCSLRQAVSDLTSRGFLVGKLKYVSGYDDLVIAQVYHGRKIDPNTLIESGSVIDLTVGLDPEHSTTPVPDLVGKHNIQAQKVLKERSLNVGRVVFDKTVKDSSDSLNAVVWQQFPESGWGSVEKGTAVNLYLSLDPDKI